MAGYHSTAVVAIFHSVMLRFSMLISISFFVCFVPASNLCMFHLVNSVSCASSYVIDPILFFDLNRVNIFIRVFIKCQSTVHIIFRFCALTISAFIISATIFCLVSNSFLIFVLNNLLFNFCLFFSSG